jgi:hypothetical protein
MDLLRAKGVFEAQALVTWDRDGEVAEVYTVPDRRAYFPDFRGPSAGRWD